MDGDAPRVRRAREADLAAIVRLLADDAIAAGREVSPDDDIAPYREAYREIAASPDHELLVLELEGEAVGVVQLSYFRCLTYRGGRRAQIEGVRVASSLRGRGLGAVLVGHAVARAREEGCHVVQLTTDRRRPAALAFYEGLGFAASHDGLKLHLR